MWGAIERMSKELQELIQGDAGIDGEEEADLVLVTTNLDTTKLAPTGTSSIGTPWAWLEGIPKEEESSVKGLGDIWTTVKIAKGERRSQWVQ